MPGTILNTQKVVEAVDAAKATYVLASMKHSNTTLFLAVKLLEARIPFRPWIQVISRPSIPRLPLYSSVLHSNH